MGENKITRDMNISEIVANWPEAVEVFALYGLHCFTCGISEFETIEQGAMAHGFDDETINMMLKDANDIIEAMKKESEN